ncbi:hypothetical protein FB451DRAFT_1190023 [Mycena latifolia]|nr:hypothetical protein FB451DRAFT_1190023 [Mycena latifolia]
MAFLPQAMFRLLELAAHHGPLFRTLIVLGWLPFVLGRSIETQMVTFRSRAVALVPGAARAAGRRRHQRQDNAQEAHRDINHAHKLLFVAVVPDIIVIQLPVEFNSEEAR